MNAMTIMRRCRAAQDDIERIQQRIEQRRDLLDSISAPPMDPNGGGRGSGDKDKTGRILADIDLLEREKAARQEAWNAERVAALSLLEMVPDRADDRNREASAKLIDVEKRLKGGK